MGRSVRCVLLVLLFTGCIEPYDFVIKNEASTLVVEGYISDVSYEETLEYPSDGRYFFIKLSSTNDVTNIRGGVVTGALVYLMSNSGDKWTYQESKPGEYLLVDKCFKASFDESYKIEITLSDDERYETDYQTLPRINPISQGEVTLEETEKKVYERIAGEEKVVTVKGIDVFIDVPVNEDHAPVYYHWDFEPTWIFKSPLAPTTCWVTNEYYLTDDILQEDYAGGYKKKLFFEKTTGNERLIWQYSILVRQFIVDEEFYRFLSDIKIQVDESLNDSPPYNLHTNIRSLGTEKKAVGYFAVISESGQRVYISQRDLSYRVEDAYQKYCTDPLGDGGPVCYDCQAYGRGKASLIKPQWWKNQ